MTVYTESFTRTDGFLGDGDAESDLPWEGAGFGPDIIDNAVKPDAGGGRAYIVYVFDDPDIRADVTVTEITYVAGNPEIDFYARATGLIAAGTHYRTTIVGIGATCVATIIKVVGVTQTQLDQQTITSPDDGDVVSFSVQGSSLETLVNDVVVASAVDSSITDGGYFQFVARGGNASNTFILDDLVITGGSTDLDAFLAPAVQTFMPPSFGRIPTTVPRGFPQWDGVSNALMRNYRPRQEGTNVYLLSDGTVTETDPDSTNVFWHSYEGSVYVKRVFWGSTADPYELTAAEATALTDAGYTVT